MWTTFLRHQILNHRKVKKKYKNRTFREVKAILRKSAFMTDFTAKEVLNAIKFIKNGKAAGAHDFLPEFLKNLRASIELQNIVNTNIFTKSKATPILKPDRETNNPKS